MMPGRYLTYDFTGDVDVKEYWDLEYPDKIFAKSSDSFQS